MSNGRIVPWASWEEWEGVREGLLFGGTSKQREALQRVATWRARGRIPLGVDMTACLTETKLRCFNTLLEYTHDLHCCDVSANGKVVRIEREKI